MELILSNSPALTALHDLSTGQEILVFESGAQAVNQKQKPSVEPLQTRCHTTTCVRAVDGYGGLIVTVGSSSGREIKIYNYTKEAAVVSFHAPVRLTAISISNSGCYLAAGTTEGTLFVWEITSGTLYPAVASHLGAITAVGWTADDCAIITASADTNAEVWTLADVLDPDRSINGSLESYLSLRGHHLGINDIALGIGRFPQTRILTAGSDGNIRLYDLRDRAQPQIGSIALGINTSVNHVVFDPSERFFYAACNTRSKDGQSTHSVIRINLYRYGTPARGAAVELAMDVSSGLPTRVDPEKIKQRYMAQDEITALHLSTLSAHLLVGTAASEIVILSLPSMQPIRTISPTKGLSVAVPNPLLFVCTMTRPLDLVPRAGFVQSAVEKTTIIPRPVKQFKTASLDMHSPDEILVRRITSNRNAFHVLGLADETAATGAQVPRLALAPLALPAVSDNTSTASFIPIEESEETTRLKAQLDQALQLNDNLWKILVEKGIMIPS